MVCNSYSISSLPITWQHLKIFLSAIGVAIVAVVVVVFVYFIVVIVVVVVVVVVCSVRFVHDVLFAAYFIVREIVARKNRITGVTKVLRNFLRVKSAIIFEIRSIHMIEFFS